ncbi:MAG: AzlD domain-containing protein [Chloroflexota bacterium]|nr:AzlD domain-containing protein [Chloroflexota bacterium]
MRLWIIVAACGAGTYGIRLSMLMFVRHSSLPRVAREALRFVTPAVLAAIIVPAVLYVGKDQHLSLSAGNDRPIAALIAAMVAWSAKNVWLTIGSGMAALWVLQSF